MPISMRMSCTAISLRRLTPPPPHLRRSPFTGLRDPGLRDPRSGTTLVELCVAMVLLVIVFTGWVRMNNIQAVNKESMRYAAIEKAAGMLDAVDANRLVNEGLLYEDLYIEVHADGRITKSSGETILPLNGTDNTIGYRFHVEGPGSSEKETWGSDGLWLAIELFDKFGSVADIPQLMPYAALRVFCSR